jgi:hypothetical protein
MRPRQKSVVSRLNPATVHLLKQFGWGLLSVSICALIITGIWYGTRLSVFTIQNVSASGGITIQSSEVIARAEPVLEGAYLKLVPRRFTYSYPEEAIEASVSTVPRIKNVRVEKESNQSILITYDEYVPDALWCDKEGKDCLFIDASGYAFGEAPDLKGGSLIRYHTSETPLKVGATPFLVDDYNQTKDFAERLAGTGWFVANVEIDSVRDVFYTLVGGGELKVTLGEKNERTLEYLNTIRISEEFSHLEPGNFEYIDLRFGTKVFVNEVKPEPMEEVASSSEEGLLLEE